jgi:hypothetical protein
MHDLATATPRNAHAVLLSANAMLIPGYGTPLRISAHAMPYAA